MLFHTRTSIFGVNVRVAWQIYIFKVKLLRSCLAISKGIKTTTYKINNFSIISSFCPKYCLQLSSAKNSYEKFSFSKLKLEKVNLFNQSLTNFYCISIFNIGGCLASCLTFRPLLTLDPQQLGCLYKEKCAGQQLLQKGS